MSYETHQERLDRANESYERSTVGREVLLGSKYGQPLASGQARESRIYEKIRMEAARARDAANAILDAPVPTTDAEWETLANMAHSGGLQIVEMTIDDKGEG